MNTPTITTFRHLPRGQFPAWPDGDLTLSHDGSGWNGTFGLTAKFMLTDALSDGAPLNHVTVVAETPEGNVVTTGTVTAVTASGIHFADGHLIEVDEEVLAVSF